MPCSRYEQLLAEWKEAQREWAYFAYDQNRELRGISDRKSKQLAKEAARKRDEINKIMSVHRIECAACKTM